MSTSIALAGLSWSLPDGTPLFTELDLTFGCERTGLVGSNGAGKSTLLHLIADGTVLTAGQGSITGSVAMMRQEALEHPDETIADLMRASRALNVIDRAEQGQATADELADADWTLPARIEAALARVDLSADPWTQLACLSGGQRSRVALAALILAKPDFLLMDEPTNNLDRAGRRAVIDLLRGWTGGAIIASHDRELLEEMDVIVELTSFGAAKYGGNYNAFREKKERERAAAAQDLVHAEKAQAEAVRRAQQAAERKARKDSTGRKSRAKGDQPKILMDAAKGRAEASGGAGVRLREDRRAAAEDALSAAREKVEVLNPLQMEVAPSGLPIGKTVLILERVTGGHNPAASTVHDFSLTITGPERVVIAGPNGSGKTSLLKLITGELAPAIGHVQVCVPWAILDQHVGMLDPNRTLLQIFLDLNAQVSTQTARATLARFRFREAHALRRVGCLSGGEKLRAGLACVLGATPPPQLLLLDEPTNHLDLEGVEALEAALACYDEAVIVVSHDQAFLEKFSGDRVVSLNE